MMKFAQIILAEEPMIKLWWNKRNGKHYEIAQIVLPTQHIQETDAQTLANDEGNIFSVMRGVLFPSAPCWLRYRAMFLEHTRIGSIELMVWTRELHEASELNRTVGLEYHLCRWGYLTCAMAPHPESDSDSESLRSWPASLWSSSSWSLTCG